MSYLVGEDGFYVTKFIDSYDEDDAKDPNFGDKNIKDEDDDDDDDDEDDEEDDDDEEVDDEEEEVDEEVDDEEGEEEEEEVDDNEEVPDEIEYTLFAKYKKDKITKCVTIGISSDATLNELKNVLSDEIGMKITGISQTFSTDMIKDLQEHLHKYFSDGDFVSVYY